MIDRASPRPLHGRKAALLALCAPLLAACGAGAGDDAPRQTSALGAKSRILFVVESERAPSAGENGFSLDLRDAATDAPLPNASVDAYAIMRSMGHDTATSSVVEIGDGAYSIEQLVFSMPGLWELRCRASRDGTTDEAAFLYDIP
jgi:hypothetical protein